MKPEIIELGSMKLCKLCNCAYDYELLPECPVCKRRKNGN